jgi:hypothetical protein
MAQLADVTSVVGTVNVAVCGNKSAVFVQQFPSVVLKMVPFAITRTTAS